MSEYRRFVAYIYEYTNGKKNKNTGFAKVESRNGICRMQIHLQKIPREEEALNIYGFVRESGWLLGILLGQIRVQGTSGEVRLQTPAQKIGGSEYALSQLSGLWVESSRGRKYLTVFDDEGIDPGKLVTELPEKAQRAEETELSGESQKAEEAELSGESQKAETAERIGERKETEKIERSEKEQRAEAIELPEQETEKEERQERGQGGEETKQPEENRESETQKENQEAHTAEIHTERKEKREKDTEEKEKAEMKNAEEVYTNTSGQKEAQKLHAQEAVCPVMGCPCRKRQICGGNLEQKWQILSSRCPHFQPFADGELADCIQITPKELNFIRQGNGRMGNNSFLMHGFCNYRHLLFGKRHDGGYILGIPGIFENQELFMANMFGFPEFKEASSRHSRGRFGYWCRSL